MAKILIVDDEQSYRHYLAARLVRDGYEVHTASSADESIELGIALRPDVLIADLLLKNDDSGLRVAEALFQLHPELRTILISGFSADFAGERVEKVPIFRWLEKPFGMEEFLESIDHLLEKEPNDSPAVTSTNALHAIPPITQERALLQYFRKLSANNKKLVVSLTRALDSPHDSDSRDEY